MIIQCMGACVYDHLVYVWLYSCNEDRPLSALYLEHLDGPFCNEIYSDYILSVERN